MDQLRGPFRSKWHMVLEANFWIQSSSPPDTGEKLSAKADGTSFPLTLPFTNFKPYLTLEVANVASHELQPLQPQPWQRWIRLASAQLQVQDWRLPRSISTSIAWGTFHKLCWTCLTRKAILSKAVCNVCICMQHTCNMHLVSAIYMQFIVYI